MGKTSNNLMLDSNVYFAMSEYFDRTRKFGIRNAEE